MEKKPIIGLLHYSYPPVVGGVEKIVFDHAQYFAKYGFKTHVFAGDGDNDNPNIQLHIVPELQSLNNTNPSLLSDIFNHPTFPKELESESGIIYKKLEVALRNIDILFIHNVLTNSLNPCINIALAKYIKNNPSKKYVSWVHDIALDPMRSPYTYVNSELTNLIYKPLPGVHYIGISQFLKNTLIKDIGLKESSVTVIPNGIDLISLLNLHPLSADICSRYELIKRDVLIFLPMKIMRHKNIDLCIRVLADIKNLKKKPMMIISANNFPHGKSGLYVSEIRKTILELNLKNDVILLHNEIDEKYRTIEYKIVDDFYRLSDIVLLLSSYENFGLPLLESGITKTPILVNNLEVFGEIEAEHIYRTDIENEDSKQIAEKVLSIVETNPQISFFRKVKYEFNFDTIFQNKILPFVS